MIRGIFGTIVGLLVAFVVIAVTDAINHRLYPPPEAIRTAAMKQDFVALRAAVKEWLPNAPLLTQILVPTGWIVGTFLGAITAAGIARARPLVPVLIVGGLVWLATMANLRMLPHPAWMAACGLIGIPLAALTAFGLTPRRAALAGPQPYDMRKKNMACK